MPLKACCQLSMKKNLSNSPLKFTEDMKINHIIELAMVGVTIAFWIYGIILIAAVL